MGSGHDGGVRNLRHFALRYGTGHSEGLCDTLLFCLQMTLSRADLISLYRDDT